MARPIDFEALCAEIDELVGPCDAGPDQIAEAAAKEEERMITLIRQAGKKPLEVVRFVPPASTQATFEARAQAATKDVVARQAFRAVLGKFDVSDAYDVPDDYPDVASYSETQKGWSNRITLPGAQRLLVVTFADTMTKVDETTVFKGQELVQAQAI